MQDTNQLNEAIFSLLHSFKVQLRGAIRNEIDGINGMQVRALLSIHRDTECTINSISTHLQRDKGQITRLVKELIAAQWVEKKPNPSDKRSQFLALTPLGLSVVERISKEEAKIIQRMSQGMSSDEIDAFYRVATKMIDNLKAEKPAVLSIPRPNI